MSKENKSKYALLGVLSLAPMSGYDLKKTIEYSIGHFWKENYAQIYPMLKQLEQEGLAVSTTEKQEGRPDRHIYAITERGKEELKQWLAEPFEVQVERNELLLKLFFGSFAQVPTSKEHVQRYHDKQEQFLQVYEQTQAHLQSEIAANEQLPYWLITLSYGKHIAQALLAWSEETLVVLDGLERGGDAEQKNGTGQKSQKR
jgi:PadR family transcriptional regulator, regulatory protein AphA